MIKLEKLNSTQLPLLPKKLKAHRMHLPTTHTQLHLPQTPHSQPHPPYSSFINTTTQQPY